MEFFIKKVKLQPCLWNINDISYRDNNKKDLAWERIARECLMANGTEAKCNWKKLRDSHREALRRRKSTTGQAAKKFKPWKYEILMEFLLPQRENNETSSNFSNLKRTSQDTQNSLDTINDFIKSPPSPTESSSSASRIRSIKKNERKRREKDRMQRRIERDELRKHIHDSNRPQDALSDLFASFCKKTRDLPKHLQLRVQRQIFENITRAEEEALSYNSTNTYYYSTPSTSNGNTSITNNYQTSNFSDPLTDMSPLPDESPKSDVSSTPDAKPSPQLH